MKLIYNKFKSHNVLYKLMKIKFFNPLLFEYKIIQLKILCNKTAFSCGCHACVSAFSTNGNVVTRSSSQAHMQAYKHIVLTVHVLNASWYDISITNKNN